MAIVLYSDYESIGTVETGSELVNKLISNIEWGMKGNFLDVPTDCPQRDERMGWTGDTQVFLRLQATWLIPMRFTENIYMTCIRNSFWRTEWFQRLSLHSDRQNVPAHGETLMYHPLERIFVQRGQNNTRKPD